MTSTPCHSGCRDDRSSPVHLCLCLCPCVCASFHFVSFIHACVAFRCDWWPSGFTLTSVRGTDRAEGGQRKADVYRILFGADPREASSSSVSEEEVTFYRTQMFFAVFTRDRHLHCPVTTTGDDICKRTTPKTEFSVTCTLLLPYSYNFCTQLPYIRDNIAVEIQDGNTA